MEQILATEQTQVTPAKNGERRIPMTYAEYLTSFEDSTHAEWVNGEAIVFMPPSLKHQDIVLFLAALMDGFAKMFGLGKVFVAPCEMRLGANVSSREPDILYVDKANVARLSENRIVGPADLVVEIISTESVSRDRGEKFYEYQANGVREYWIIDPRPDVARADFWVLDDEGRYRPIPIGEDGIYHSTVLPNFKLDVNGLLAEELPNPLQALAKMVGVEALMRSLGSEK